MFGAKYEKMCAKHFGVQCSNPGNASSSKPESEDDDDESSDGAAEPSNDGSRDEEGTWEDAFGVRWKESDAGYYWQDENGTWLPYTEESDEDIDENAADKATPKEAAI